MFSSFDFKPKLLHDIILMFYVFQVVDVSFESFNVDNPPTCSIPWNFTYRWPTGKSYSALPGCFTKVVQPAFDFYLEHSFFFKIYDWKGHFENINETPQHLYTLA